MRRAIDARLRYAAALSATDTRRYAAADATLPLRHTTMPPAADAAAHAATRCASYFRRYDATVCLPRYMLLRYYMSASMADADTAPMIVLFATPMRHKACAA